MKPPLDDLLSMPGIAEVLVNLYGGLGWKQHEAEWSKYLVDEATLEAQRKLGDPAVDEVMELLKPGYAEDVVGLVEAIASGSGVGKGTEEKSQAAFAERVETLDQATREKASEFWSAMQQPPSWVDWDTVNRGQEVFWRFAGPKLMLLLHFSLLVGVSAPKVNKVLLSTGYLTRPGEKTFKRLLETTSWLVAVMESGALQPLGSGWKACLKVRFLHAHVRQRLRALAAKDPSIYDENVYGVPINQEDSAATILAFVIPLELLEDDAFTFFLVYFHDSFSPFVQIVWSFEEEKRYRFCSIVLSGHTQRRMSSLQKR